MFLPNDVVTESNERRQLQATCIAEEMPATDIPGVSIAANGFILHRASKVNIERNTRMLITSNNIISLIHGLCRLSLITYYCRCRLELRFYCL